MTPAPVAVVATENYPVPPVLGGAVATYVSELAPRLDGGRQVTVVSVRHPGLPDDERTGRVHHRRVGPSALAGSLIRLVPSRRSWRGDAEKRVYLEAVAAVLRGFDGTIIVGNRPRSVPRLRRAAPSARIVLRLDNLHLRNPEALAACDALMPCSRFVGNAAAAAAARPVPVRVVHNGVDLEAFRPHDEAERAEAKRALDLPEGPVVLFVGRLVPDKGAHLLLEAVPALLRRRLDLSVVLVGSARFGRGGVTDYERELRARAEALGPGVRLAGFVPPASLPAWFAAADVFCAPGLWDEPFGMVYAESMASGVPPVGTARGGIPEVVDDGETGLLLPRSPTAADVEERLAALLEDPALRERLGRAGRAAAEARFSWDAMARATEDLLR